MQRRLIVRLAATALVPAALGVGLAVPKMPAQERSPTRTSAEAPPDAAIPKKAEAPARPGVPHAAPGRVTHVTVYQNNALVTRQVDVPDGAGTFELVVTPLPPQTVNGSLYSEGTDGLRVLTTRYRTRPIQEDTREEVRKLEAQLKTLQAEQQQEPPLWDPHSQVIYWWTATEVDDRDAFIVVYNGPVWPRPKKARWGYLAFRAVREPDQR
jgi:hypothetical protein